MCCSPFGSSAHYSGQNRLTLQGNYHKLHLRWQGAAFALVLDDYHVVEAPPIHHALTYLVEHLPPQMHLIIVTRADPPLPLARLRARGQLTELRAAELRFRDAEADAFLSECQDKSLAEAERFLIV